MLCKFDVRNYSEFSMKFPYPHPGMLISSPRKHAHFAVTATKTSK